MTTTTIATEYDQQAEDFLAQNAIGFRAKHRGDKCPKWGGYEPKPRHGGECRQCGTIHGDRYRVTLWRIGWGGPGGTVSFDFWDSHKNASDGKALTAYEVLACISSDVHCPETFDDFCAEYGYEEDSRKAHKIFKRSSLFAGRLRAFFDDAEIESLQEIR